jgi:hypothetical protein
VPRAGTWSGDAADAAVAREGPTVRRQRCLNVAVLGFSRRQPVTAGGQEKGLQPTFPLVRGPSEHVVTGEGFEPS